MDDLYFNVGPQKESLKPKRKVKPMEPEAKAWLTFFFMIFLAAVGSVWGIAYYNVNKPIDTSKGRFVCPSCGSEFLLVKPIGNHVIQNFGVQVGAEKISKSP